MRWFKHMTLTRSDERVAAYVAECGMEGYGFFWVVLETVALTMDKTGKCEVFYPLNYWVTQAQLHRTKVTWLLNVLKKYGLLIVNFTTEGVGVKIPNLLKYRDEYTQRSGQTPDKLPTKYRDTIGTLSGQTPDQDTDTDTDTEKKEKQEKEKKAAPFSSGKPDCVFSDQKIKKSQDQAQRKSEAIEVLNFLNEKIGKRYRPVEANLKPIEARLSSGVSIQQCRSVIAMKRREWLFNEDFKKHLNPITLFRPSNFEKYLGQLEIIPEEGEGENVR